MATIWTDPDPDELLAAIPQCGSHDARPRASVPVMTRRLTARLCIRYVHDAYIEVYCFLRDFWLQPRLDARRQRRRQQQEARAWAFLQQQVQQTGFSGVIFAMPQIRSHPRQRTA